MANNKQRKVATATGFYLIVLIGIAVAINLLARAGIIVAWITGSAAPSVTHRAQQLRIPHVVLDAHDKLTPWERLRGELGVAADECAHIGDDLPDIALLEACGLAVTVPHAPAAVRAHAHYVTTREGGSGAVRELADLILAAQGRAAENRLAQLPPVELAREVR